MSNSELRKRKVQEHEKSSTTKKRKSKKAKKSSIQTSLICLIISGTILTAFLGEAGMIDYTCKPNLKPRIHLQAGKLLMHGLRKSPCILTRLFKYVEKLLTLPRPFINDAVLYADQIPWHIGNQVIDDFAKRFLGYHKPIHAVVIDAGSTGSRVLAYTFHKSYLGNSLVLDKELFEYNKPGLSSFAKEPEKGAAKIAALLELAKKEIPQEYWGKTPLILKATAGLRLLPADQAENLLNAVKELFKRTPFLTDENSVEIMDGTDEGIFSWFTVNFLLHKINSDPANTVAALDLGGGSTQVTFAAVTPSSLQDKENIHQATSPSGSIPVFTHSYLGLGLMAGRKAVISNGQGDSVNITCKCVNPVVKNKKFHYHGTDYYVSGLQEGYSTTKTVKTEHVGEEIPVVDVAECSKIIHDYVEDISSKLRPPEELPLKSIFAFSYYYDKASQAGLIDFDKGGQVKVADFKKQAERTCHEANPEQPFICLDMTFIWLLLEKGFGLSLDTKIYLYKKISGHEISWALGAAYDVLRKSNSV